MQTLKPWVKAFLTSLLLTITYAALLLSPSLQFQEKYIAEGEDQQAKCEVQTVLDFLEYETDNLATLVEDWADWNDTYQFAVDRNQAYIDNNLWGKTLNDLRVNLFAIIDSSGSVFYSKMNDSGSKNQSQTLMDIEVLLSDYPDLILKTNHDGSISTIVLTDTKVPMLVAAKPILTSTKEGPPHGILLLGRNIDTNIIDKISSIIHKKIILHPLDDLSPPIEEKAVKIQPGENFSLVVDSNTIAGFGFLIDAHGEPVSLMEIQSTRTQYMQGLENQRVYLIMFTRSTVLFFIVFLLLLLLYYRSRQNEYTTFTRLQETQERYELAIRGSNDGIWDWDLMNNELHFSDRWIEQLGIPKDEFVNKPQSWLNRIHVDDRDNFQVELMNHLGKQTDHFECQYRIQHADGSFRWMVVRGQALWDKNHYPYRIAGSQTDITLDKKREEQLRLGALYDPLTNLPNRTLFEDRLNHAFGRDMRKAEASFGLLYLNLSRFKHINENYGYGIGDQILAEVAARIQRCIRASIDTPSRLMGNEFMIILEDVHNITDIQAVAQRVQQEISQPFRIQDHEIYLASTIIIHKPPKSQRNLEDILQDIVLVGNTMRNPDKNNLIVLDDDLLSKSHKQLVLENEIRLAVVRNEFILHYQPIYSMQEERIIRLEALLRWKHPQRGIIPPDDFIPILESTGLIIPVGLWVIRTGCNQVKTWQVNNPDAQSMILNVNLSVIQITDPHLPEQIAQTLNEINYPSSQLCLEITETVLMENLEFAMSTLNRLIEMGIHVEIDDFGTGYSSFSYLKNLPVNGLKIDRTFIGNLDSDPNEKEILKTLLDLSHTLGLYCIAEGVETVQQHNILKEMNCPYSQGFYYCKPAQWEIIEEQIRKDRHS